MLDYEAQQKINCERHDRSKAVVLLWFYVACFGVRVSVMFHLMFVHNILVRFRLLSGHQELLTRLTICSLCSLRFEYLQFKLFPVLALRAEFGFCLLQFLGIAYLLLLQESVYIGIQLIRLIPNQSM